MNLSPTAQATLLLTSYFNKASREDVKPLTNSEWGRFALWLKEKSITPAELLNAEPQSLLRGWQDARISADRILRLLNRGHSLALALEKWQRAGLWVVTRSDSEYPKRLKQRLKNDSPAVLFGCGERSLLNSGGLAVVGSRNASNSDLAFTQKVGGTAAAEVITIVSGGARGVDETAMLGALSQGGTVVGIMADSLLRAATSAKWRKGLMDGNLALVSPYYPEAGFSAGNAMARNKYIYCLADSSLVVHSGRKGGTLNGAEENLKKHWVPLWVKPTEDESAANADLVKKGGRWCSSSPEDLSIASLLNFHDARDSQPQENQSDLFGVPEDDQHSQPTDAGTELRETMLPHTAPDSLPPADLATVSPDASPINFYLLFLQELHRLAETPITLAELQDQTALNKSQISDWLKFAVDDGVVEKLSRPVRYRWIKNSKQGSPCMAMTEFTPETAGDKSK